MEVNRRTKDRHVGVDSASGVGNLGKKRKRIRNVLSGDVAAVHTPEIVDLSGKLKKKVKKRRRKSSESSFPDSYKFFPSPPKTLRVLYDEQAGEFEGILGPKVEYECQDQYFHQIPEYPGGVEDVLGFRDEEENKRDEEEGNEEDEKEVKSKEEEGEDEEVESEEEEGEDEDDDEEVEKRCSTDKHVDIIKALSNKGKRDYLVKKNGKKVRVETLKGKHVVICCFFVPILNDSCQVEECRAMMSAHSELSALGRPNFEIVIVAKMRSTWDTEAVFNHFFSGFLDDTLAIPFWDSESRDRLCKSLNLESDPESIATLIVDPEGLVLKSSTDAPDNFQAYGSDYFPFTDNHLDALGKADEILKLRLDAVYKETEIHYLKSYGITDEGISSRLSLAELLGCDSLSRICDFDDSDDDEEDSISVSDLSQNVVGVYLCRDGLCLDMFHEVQQRCLSRGRDFVIVLVCLAFGEDHCSFFNHIKLALKKYNIRSWWLFPFNEKTCRTLWRITGCSVDDQMIIVPPGEKSAELEGESVLTNFGDINYHPFTRESIVDKRLAKLKSYTIKSLFKDFKYLVWGKDSRQFPVADLIGRKILIYVDEFDRSDEHCLYKLLSLRYSDIQLQHQRAEVVFLPMNSHLLLDKRVLKMPWLKLPVPSTSVFNQLLSDVGETRYLGHVLAFGEDGRMVSRHAQAYLKKDKIDVSSLFNDKLRQELMYDIAESEAHLDEVII